MRFPESADKDVLIRLRRVEGQIRGVQKLVEQGADCKDIVTQLAAAKSALDRVGFKLMAAGMKECLGAADSQNNDADHDTEELERLFMKLS